MHCSLARRADSDASAWLPPFRCVRVDHHSSRVRPIGQAWFNNRRQKQVRERALARANAEKRGVAPDVIPDEYLQRGSDSEATELNEDAKEIAKVNFLKNLLVWARDHLPVSYREDGPRLSIAFDDPPELTKNGKRKRGGGPKKAKKVARKEPKEPRMTKKQMAAKRRVENEARRNEERMQRELEKARDKIARQQMLDQKKAEKMQAQQQREREKEEQQRQRELVKAEREQKKQAERERKEREREEARRLKEEEREKEAERLRLERLQARMVPDDEDLERKELAVQELASRHAIVQSADTDAAAAGGGEGAKLEEGMKLEDDVAKIAMQVKLPEFPPTSVNIKPVYAKFPEMLKDSALQSRLISIWSFISCFGPLVGLQPIDLADFLSVVDRADMCDADFVRIHTALLRCVVGDMDEVESMRSNQQIGTHESAYTAATMTWKEGWLWGFDLNTWRAHINVLSWPEVMRQWACASGLGRRRPRYVQSVPATEERGADDDEEAATAAAPKPHEDVQLPPDLKMPSSIMPGSVKHAVWAVLARAGDQGMHTEAIAKQIVDEGLRENSSSIHVTNTIRNDRVFRKVGPSRYCLRYYAVGSAVDDEKEEVARDEDGGREGVLALETKEFCDMPVRLRVDAMEDIVESAMEGIMVRFEVDERLAQLDEMKRQLTQQGVEERDKIRQEAMHAIDALKMESEANPEAAVSGQQDGAGAGAAEANGAGGEPGPAGNGENGAGTLAAQGSAAAVAAAEAAQEALQNTKGLRDIQAESAREAQLHHRIRENFLGEDRRCNKYWRFMVEGPRHVLECRDTTREHESVGRIFVEKNMDDSMPAMMIEQKYHDSTPKVEWYVIDTESGLDALMQSLDERGLREKKLLRNLEFNQARIRSAMRGMREKGSMGTVRNYRNDLKSSKQLLYTVKLNASAIATKGRFNIDDNQTERDFKMTDDLRVRFIKRSLKDIEAAIPYEAVNEDWRSLRGAWLSRVTTALTLEDLRACLGTLETTIKSEWISEYYAGVGRQPAHPPPLRVLAAAADSGEGEAWTEVQSEPLDWLPATSAAVSLRMLALDSSIVYKFGHYMARDKSSAYNMLSRYDDQSCLLQWDVPSKTRMPVKVAKREASARALAKKSANGGGAKVPPAQPQPSSDEKHHANGKPSGKRATSKIVYKEPESDEDDVIEYEEDEDEEDAAGLQDEEYNAAGDDDNDDESDSDFEFIDSLKKKTHAGGGGKANSNKNKTSYDDHDDSFDD